MPFVKQLAGVHGLLLGRRVEDRLKKLVQVVRRDAASLQRLLRRDQTLVHEIDGDPDGGEAGSLGVAGLEHPDLALLDRELDVLHFLVVLLELLARSASSCLYAFGHVLAERLFDSLRRADAGDDVFALGVDEVVAVEHRLADGAVAGQADAGRAIVAQVAEDHRLHVAWLCPTRAECRSRGDRRPHGRCPSL